MKLGFSGFGGKYCVGKLTENEITNIIELLARFDPTLFLSLQETTFDTHDFKTEYYDFDDVYDCETVSLPCDITINELPENCKSNLMDVFTSDDLEMVVKSEKPLEDGFYLMSTVDQRGGFFTIDIDVHPEDFDKSLLIIYGNDLDNFSMSDIVLEDIYYDGMSINFDTDSYYTDDNFFKQSIFFRQSILYVENGTHYDGIEAMRKRITKEYPKIDSFSNLNTERYIKEYLEFVEAKNNGYLLNKGYMMSFASPMLYDNYSKEDIDALWMTEENIKFVLSHDLLDTMPTDVYDRIIGRFPEWLI